MRCDGAAMAVGRRCDGGRTALRWRSDSAAMAVERRCGLLFSRLSMRVPTGGLVADFSEGTISVAGGGRYAALVYAVPSSALGKGVYTQNLCFLRLRGAGPP